MLATVVHLKDTAHVLAAVTAGGRALTLAELTGGEHLRVRAGARYVNVPVSVLSATRVTVVDGLLDRPLEFVVTGAGDSAAVEPGPGVDTTNPPGKAPGPAAYVVVWQAEKATVEAGTLDKDEAPPTSAPTGTLAALAAYKGSKLSVRETSGP
jgi:hypothetical protein